MKELILCSCIVLVSLFSESYQMSVMSPCYAPVTPVESETKKSEYYYDKEKNICMKFERGFVGSGDNKFDDRKECKKACVKKEGKKERKRKPRVDEEGNPITKKPKKEKGEKRREKGERKSKKPEFECPASEGLGACAVTEDSCTSDDDCKKKMKCCKVGCGNVCVGPDGKSKQMKRSEKRMAKGKDPNKPKKSKEDRRRRKGMTEEEVSIGHHHHH